MLRPIRGLFSGIRQQIVKGANSILAIFTGSAGSVAVDVNLDVLPIDDTNEQQEIFEQTIEDFAESLDAFQDIEYYNDRLQASDFANPGLRIVGPFLTMVEAERYLQEVTRQFGSPEYDLHIAFVDFQSENAPTEYEFYVVWIPSP